MLIIEVHSYFAYFRNAPPQTHYLSYTFLLFSTNYELPMMWSPNSIFILQPFIFKISFHVYSLVNEEIT